MCLDPSGAVHRGVRHHRRRDAIALDMVNTPITANNFAVLALNRYYDNTLLFRTDPGIGIIQGGGAAYQLAIRPRSGLHHSR